MGRPLLCRSSVLYVLVVVSDGTGLFGEALHAFRVRAAFHVKHPFPCLFCDETAPCSAD